MAGHVPAMNVFLAKQAVASKTWMPATSDDKRGHDAESVGAS